MTQNKIINKLKEARAMYISLKEQHCPNSILKFWGDECLRLRKIVEKKHKSKKIYDGDNENLQGLRKQVNRLSKFKCSEFPNNSNVKPNYSIISNSSNLITGVKNERVK